PPGAFETAKPTPRRERPAETMKVDPRIIRKVAPPEPTPAPPPPKQPERVVKELPSAPVPKPNVVPPPDTTPAKTDAPKQPLKLETPDEQPKPNNLLLPKNSPGRAIQDSMRDAAKMNAPRPIGGDGPIPTRGAPGGGGRGSGGAGLAMLEAAAV